MGSGVVGKKEEDCGGGAETWAPGTAQNKCTNESVACETRKHGKKEKDGTQKGGRG